MNRIDEIKEFYFKTKERHALVVFRAVLVDIPFLLSEIDRLEQENSKFMQDLSDLRQKTHVETAKKLVG